MVTLYLTLSSLSTRKLSAKFYVKLQVVNKSSIKTNVDLNKKDKTNYKLLQITIMQRWHKQKGGYKNGATILF